MVNFGLNSASILGIALAAAGASLYFLRSVRPELSRDHDIFFAAVGLLCGFILLFQGWRLDPILQFGQFLLSGSAVFFAIESIRLRGLATEQARRNTPIVDDERPVSRVYRAELDQIEPYQGEERYERRLRGYPEPRSSRSRGYEDEAPRGTSTRPSSRPTNRPPTDYGDRPVAAPLVVVPVAPPLPADAPPVRIAMKMVAMMPMAPAVMSPMSGQKTPGIKAIAPSMKRPVGPAAPDLMMSLQPPAVPVGLARITMVPPTKKWPPLITNPLMGLPLVRIKIGMIRPPTIQKCQKAIAPTTPSISTTNCPNFLPINERV